MYRLEKLNEKGEVEKSKEYKTIKECAKAFDMPYHVIQRLVYYSSGDMKYKKAVTSRTKKLITEYRIIKVDKVIEVDMKEKDEKKQKEVLEEIVEKNV